MDDAAQARVGLAGRLLNTVEWLGNKLPDPLTLFVIGALLVPYSVVFLVTWTALLLGWVSFGIPLGPEGPLEYVPG